MRLRAAAAVMAALVSPTFLLGPSTAAADTPRKPRSAVGPIRLVARGNDRIGVAGLHDFLDTIEIKAASDGLVVVNRLPLERYVFGLNEVPPDWPLEALKAQAVAARTFALWTLLRPPLGDAATYGFDICATIECQVFSGAEILSLTDGHRWVQAVTETSGEGVLYGGKIILARYHSVSGGRTFDNEDVFFGEPAYPYLQSVPSPAEQASPLYRWHVTFSRRNLQALLERAGWWGRGKGRLIGARTIPSQRGLPYPDIRFTGTKGGLIRFGDDFRTIARELAPGMFPGVYPSPADTSSGRLPETLPSERFRVVTAGETVHFYGRGWGHGAGMSQWGAHGMALLGADYKDILEHYYTGTRVGKVAYPGPIGVGVAWGRDSVTVEGAFRLVDGRGKTLVENAFGTWGFTFTGGETIAIDPGGVGPPVRAPRPVRRPELKNIEVEILRAPRRVLPGDAARLRIRVARAARISTITEQAPRFSDLNVELVKRGERNVGWVAPLKPGSYRVRVRATAPGARGTSKAVEITVRARAKGSGPPRLLDRTKETSASAGLVLSALALLLVVGTGVVAGTIAWWPKRRPLRTR